MKEFHFQHAEPYALFILNFFWCKQLAILIWKYIKNKNIRIFVQATNAQHIFWNYMGQIARWLFRKYRMASERFGERKFYFWPLMTPDISSSQQEQYFRNKIKICLLMPFSISPCFLVYRIEYMRVFTSKIHRVYWIPADTAEGNFKIFHYMMKTVFTLLCIIFQCCIIIK